MMKKSTKWKWEHALKLEAKGHRIFRDARNDFKAPEQRGWAIADNSGNYPDQTDDGVLWLDFTQPMVVTVGKYNGAALTVYSERDTSRSYTVSVGIEAFLTLRKHFRAWPVVLSGDAKALFIALSLDPAVSL